MYPLLLVALILSGCATELPIVVIDCDPTKRADCRAISPEAIMGLANMVEATDALLEEVKKCEEKKYQKAANGNPL